MADVEITGIDGIRQKLDALQNAREEALNLAGASLLADVQQSFIKSMGMEQEPWAERKPQMRKGRRIDTWKLLWKTGTLYDSQTMKIDLEENSIEVGSAVKYARFLNQGTKFMPARSFLFLDDQRVEDATNAYKSVLLNAMKGETKDGNK